MTAGEIRALAVRRHRPRGHGAGPVLAASAEARRFLTRELGCVYLGVDASAAPSPSPASSRATCRAAATARPRPQAAPSTSCSCSRRCSPSRTRTRWCATSPRRSGPAGASPSRWRRGRRSTAERAAIPDADTVWLTPLDEMATSLGRAGLVVAWQEDHSRAHRAMAQALGDAFAADAEDIAAQIGRRALDELLAAHRLWIEWLDEGGSEARTGGGAPQPAPMRRGRVGQRTPHPRGRTTRRRNQSSSTPASGEDDRPQAHRCDPRDSSVSRYATRREPHAGLWGRLLRCREMRADQDVVVTVRGRHHLRRGRAERAASVDVLKSGGLLGGSVGAGPDAGGGAGVATVDVTPEGDGACGRATCKERREFDALRVVPGDLNGRACVQVGGAHVDVHPGGDAQPPAPLDAGLCLEVLVVGGLNGCLGQYRVTEERSPGRTQRRRSPR